MNDSVNELLQAVKLPEPKGRKPSNSALYAAIIFANAVFLLLDLISGATVWWMTDFLLYGILTFLAGFGPLLLHEFLFVRAFASQAQKNIAVFGAVAALLSIMLIGVLAGYVNIVGAEIAPQNIELATIMTLVLVASLHAILAVVYFYIDPGIAAKQQTAQALARAMQREALMLAGDRILEVAQRSVAKRHEIGRKHNEQALAELLHQFGWDEDGDGVPDFLQRKAARQYSSDTGSVRAPVSRDPQEDRDEDPNALGR